MARANRLLALGALALCLCALLRSSTAVAKVAAPSPQEGLAGSIALVLAALFAAVSSLAPGLLVAVGLYSVYQQRDRLSARTKGGLAVLALLGVLALVSLNMATGQAAERAAEKTAPGGGADKAAFVGQPHSGEEVLMSDGTFMRMADPTSADGTLGEDWRQKLANELVQALAKGQEQVVLMFTRQGCPWCDRQLPVLQDAIRKRAAVAAGAAGAVAGTAFVGGGGGASLLSAPLRVFILDAQEFPSLVQQFRIEAFPTSLIFGRPRVVPFLGRGYLDEETLDQVIREAALAEPEPEEAAQPRKGQKGKGRGGRKLFR